MTFSSLRRIVGLSLFALAMSCSWSNLSMAETRLLVGAAQTDITPPTGFPMAGYYHERLAEGTIDPLLAKALVFDQGDVRTAMVVCDLIGISRDLCLEVRRRASKATGIPEQFIAVSGTHSHTAPDYTRRLVQTLENSRAGKTSEGQSEVDAYPEKLIQGIADAVIEANRCRAPVTLAIGTGEQSPQVSFNRRFIVRDGSTQTWRNFSDKNVVRSAGPIDPELSVATFVDEAGKAQAVLSNFALHLDTVGGMRWSADYPGFIAAGVRKNHGSDVVSIFGTGCCGDINHVDPRSTERNKTDFIGNSIAASLESVLSHMQPVEETRLAAHSTVVNLPLQEVSAEDISRSVQLMELIRNGGKVEFLDHVRAYKQLITAQFRSEANLDMAKRELGWGRSLAWAGIGDSLPVDVQTITIGSDLAIVFLPGEIFTELGLAIKQASPFNQTVVIELSNAVETIYVPTRSACVGGSYEVTNSTVKPGAGELLVEAALGLLKESANAGKK
ncbi:MAG: neutral/alkaline non-lysosomal ceramidase N-terminal domain-containing protein [Pirellulales bacterium]